jgi:hypothetical protein
MSGNYPDGQERIDDLPNEDDEEKFEPDWDDQDD